jgi:tetratricopeptide (TPR) repeat protein
MTNSLGRSLLLILLIFGPFVSGAQTPDFETANKLYYEGKFNEAACAYEKLLQSTPRSPVLAFNLGNAFFKAGQLGRAVAAYRRAEKFSPRDPDVRANLQFARNQVQGPTLKADRYLGWISRLTVNEWTALASVSFWLLCLILIARESIERARKSLQGLAAGFGILTLILCICLGFAWQEQRSTLIAVVAAPEAPIRAGPFETAKNLFTAHDGAELKVLDQKNDWVQVTPDDQRAGWLPRSAIIQVGQ